MKKTALVSLSGIVLFLFILFPFQASPESLNLQKGIEQYKGENYVEAIGYLEKARKEDPRSSSAAFFLGLSYKQLLDHQKAEENLRDAVTLTPKIQEALVELIAVLYEQEKLKEAKKWIQVAEKEGIYPAKTSFLKGLILRKEGALEEAAEAFERAKGLDESLTQSADVQIALCHAERGRYQDAKKSLQAVIQRDPRTGLAGFARQYQGLIDKQIESERPFHLTLALHGQYDTNVVLDPSDPAVAPDITDESSGALASALILDYIPRFQSPWLFNAQYAGFGNFYDKFSDTHNNMSHSLSVAPGYNFGKSALNLSTKYIHSYLKRPNWAQYLGFFNVGPLYRAMVAENQIVELSGTYFIKNYFESALIPDEDRDSTGWDLYLSYIWFYKPKGFLNLKFGFNYDDADGVNWESRGAYLSVNAAIPLIEKLKLQLAGSLYNQDYVNVNTIFGVARDDTNYTLQAGLVYEVMKNLDLVFQFTGTRVNSTIAIYDYSREIYSFGVEYRY